jgi:hypothetical protein
MPLPLAVPIVGGIAALSLIGLRIRAMVKAKTIPQSILSNKQTFPVYPTQQAAQTAARAASPTQSVTKSTADAAKYFVPADVISKAVAPPQNTGIADAIAMQIYPGDVLTVNIGIAKLAFPGYPTGTFMMIATAPADMASKTIMAKPALPDFGTTEAAIPWASITGIQPGDEIGT